MIETKTRELLDRYDLYDEPNDDGQGGGLGNHVADAFGIDPDGGVGGRVIDLLGYEEPVDGVRDLEGIEVRPEPVLLEEDADILNEYQVEKLLYYLERDFIGYERIDGIKHDINVEDISCDGYNSPVFVYHSDYEQIITNVYHEEDELDDFVVKLAQRSGKGISKRRPQVDATLPDGSRAQLTLGREVSDHGTNYTIRQFKDVPFTPVDLINWQTFSLDEMAFLWLCIENHKSLIFAGGTASGKTTSLNAVSLFIPSNTKIVSIEDTREVELPQRNWIASVTRPSFSDDDKGDVDEFDLLEAALRQRPDYIVMGEIRGEEGRTLFQVMSTGHTTYTTFHADNVGEVLKRFTTEPINVSKTMFTALDLVSIQTSTRVQGQKVRRNKSLTEINHYDAENDEINVQDVYQWQAETDEFLKMGNSNTLEEIMFDRGWDREKLDLEIFKRQTVLAYLIHEGLNTYTQVAATFQAFINDPETILSLMANDQLEASLEDLREMESVLIDIDPEKEEMVPRPDPNDEILAETRQILDRAEEELFEQYYGETPDGVADALVETQPQGNVEATTDAAGELPAGAESVGADDGPDRDAIDAGSDDQEAIDDSPDEEPMPELGPGDDEPDGASAGDDGEAATDKPAAGPEPESVDEAFDTSSTTPTTDDGEPDGESAAEPSDEGQSADDPSVGNGFGTTTPTDEAFEAGPEVDDEFGAQPPTTERFDDAQSSGDGVGDQPSGDDQFDDEQPIDDPFADDPAGDGQPGEDSALRHQSEGNPAPMEGQATKPVRTGRWLTRNQPLTIRSTAIKPLTTPRRRTGYRRSVRRRPGHGRVRRRSSHRPPVRDRSSHRRVRRGGGIRRSGWRRTARVGRPRRLGPTTHSVRWRVRRRRRRRVGRAGDPVGGSAVRRLGRPERSDLRRRRRRPAVRFRRRRRPRRPVPRRARRRGRLGRGVRERCRRRLVVTRRGGRRVDEPRTRRGARQRLRRAGGRVLPAVRAAVRVGERLRQRRGGEADRGPDEPGGRTLPLAGARRRRPDRWRALAGREPARVGGVRTRADHT
ncbi:type IV secretion system ATPase VirB11 [Halolamina pelagica]|uniref:Type IV secretion system ATPase VirB11 n=1 Tax=Halolamina pelagica TaxID=699431 RepID=A0A0P7GRJ9_9EURY|nr:type IV secretion system ATPase VirB11 [Halolamina pelagica]